MTEQGAVAGGAIPPVRPDARVVPVAVLDALVDDLVATGHQVVGPTVRDGVIEEAELTGSAELPRGVGAEQGPGRYRLVERPDEARFGFVPGGASPKRWLRPPETVLFRAERSAAGEVTVRLPGDEPPPLALVGVRSCELHGIAVQDRVLVDGAHPDATYARRRSGAVVVAVECGEPAATCFCTSMGAGPGVPDPAVAGADLVLTELLPGDDPEGAHELLVRPGTARGVELLAAAEGAIAADGGSGRPATDADLERARAVVDASAAAIVRHLPTAGLHDALLGALDHPRWEQVAERCLSCTNCTLVCPTCFCVGIADETDPGGVRTDRVQRWDSCFSAEFSLLHEGPVRATTADRYRQWLTHKLATWVDQFGEVGCVGCGRCITWCPVGIDLTEEVAAIRSEPTLATSVGSALLEDA